MATLIDGTMGDLSLAVVILGDYHTGGEPVAQHLGGTLGHLPGSLTGSDQINPAAGKLFALQSAAHSRIGQTGGQGRLNDLLRISTSGHSAGSFLRFFLFLTDPCGNGSTEKEKRSPSIRLQYGMGRSVRFYYNHTSRTVG